MTAFDVFGSSLSKAWEADPDSRAKVYLTWILLISYDPMAPLFVKLALRIDSFVEAGPTTDVKTHTYHFDGEREQCSYLKQ